MTKKSEENKMEKIVDLAKRRGFIFQSSEIYGGINSCYDFGPLGAELKNNLKKLWWQDVVHKEPDMVGIDASILMHPRVWEASGHVAGFTDPLVDCKQCKRRFRADHLLESKGIKPDFTPGGKFPTQDVKCPECEGELTEARDFNLMFKSFMGPVEEEAALVYLRPETAQGSYVNFENVKFSSRKKIPFGIAQIGKAFRNEITPGNFVFRTREFEQMEMQWFCRPPELAGDQKKPEDWFKDWQKKRMDWLIDIGLNKKNLKFRAHAKDELAHYAKQAIDIEYNFPFGFKELEGIHNRGDWDLSQHQKASGKDLTYFDDQLKKSYLPWVVETAGGVERLALAILVDAYQEVSGGRTKTTESNKEVEVVLRLDKRIAPVKAAILPLSKKEPLTKQAKEIFIDLATEFSLEYDETGSVGKRYRRQDEIGTPYCITVDFETAEDKKVTVRDRDTMEQERVEISQLKDYLRSKLS